ncbi:MULTISPECIES: exopolysaccharide biosynthesis polyprenyl glycosylphosphotransferase [unclassified Empedobacter]|uniref:exopolysaccharide biosynthesis polyprenyl glycosylphosphotransferase n=1 Tax=unclassified Empedobacter TaxID=2643773 RepID=UPI0025BFBBD0|nr:MULTISPECIES: exopolysaccharide biosynthesis polyprenyl glycosylphosphotransferase [unclassified Empedobacter]
MGNLNKFNFSIKIGFYILDALIIFFGLLFFICNQYQYFYHTKLARLPYFSELLDAHYKAILLLLFAWFVISDYVKLYSIKRVIFLREILRKIVLQTFFFCLIIFTISGIKKEELLANQLIVYFVFILFAYLIFTRLLVFLVSRYNFQKGNDVKNVIVLGENSNTPRFKSIIENRKHYGYRIIKTNNIIDNDSLETVLLSNKVKEIFISQLGLPISLQEQSIVNFCEDHHVKVSYIPYSLNTELVSLDVVYIDTLPIFRFKKFPLEKTENRLIKSLFDVIISCFVLIFIMSWLFPIIAILIRLDSKGPILFKQKRRGINGVDFDCYKFRTMRNDGTNSIKATVVNDNRITKIGKFLRKASLDELPQFFNVLNGDMSIVGPRPHMISQDIHYSEIIRKYNLRNYVKPGITGLAQVKGYRGAIDCDKDMEDRIRTDIFYVRNWSLLLDLQIIYQTVVLIFKGDENAI